MARKFKYARQVNIKIDINDKYCIILSTMFVFGNLEQFRKIKIFKNILFYTLKNQRTYEVYSK